MSDKLLKVYVNNKEIYYVKETGAETFYTHEYIKVYAVYNDKDEIEQAFTLSTNAFIYAIELGQRKGKGNCTAYYIEEKEKLVFENYKLTMRISNLKNYKSFT